MARLKGLGLSLEKEGSFLREVGTAVVAYFICQRVSAQG
jgi:hypothetical protein